MSVENTLQAMLSPESIAVIGASADPAKWGHRLVQNTVALGYEGRLWAVNPRHSVQIDGSRPAGSIAEIDERIDLAIAAVPQGVVTDVVRDCAERRVRVLVLPASGFGETGEAGAVAEREIAAISRDAGMRILGPNCFGLFSSVGAINTTPFAPIPAGDIGLVSQSGNVAGHAFIAARTRGLGFSHVVGLGNQLDISFAEVIALLAEDEQTRRVALYLEGIQAHHANDLVDAMARCRDAGKTVAVVKAGGSAAGRAVALSHTGSLATEDRVWDEVIRTAGAVRVGSIDDLFGVLSLASLPRPQGRRLVVMTDGGGDSIMAVDGVERYGLDLAALPEKVQGRLDDTVPPAAPRVAGRNPVTLDTAGGVDDDPEVIPRCLQALGDARDIDVVVVGGLYGTYTHVREGEIRAAHAILERVREQKLRVVLHSPIGADQSPPLQILQDAGVPVFGDMDALLRSLALWLPESVTQAGGAPPAAPTGSQGWSLEAAHAMLTDAKVELPMHRFVEDEHELAQVAGDIGFPVCLKTADPSIIHKSDVGGVRVGLSDLTAVTAAAGDIREATGSGRLLVMPSLRSGVEVLMGARLSTHFGPVVVIGRGGIWTEMEDDTATFVGQIDETEFETRLRRLRCAPMLFGGRGQPSRDVASLLPLARALMQAVREHPQTSIELNPVFLYEEGFAVADIRVVDGA